MKKETKPFVNKNIFFMTHIVIKLYIGFRYFKGYIIIYEHSKKNNNKIELLKILKGSMMRINLSFSIFVSLPDLKFLKNLHRIIYVMILIGYFSS